MSKGFSVYLDLFRFMAALIVLVYHAMNPEMGWTGQRFPYGAEAVMAFFVLSGFVIAYVADARDSNATEFMVSRLARLWSVILPALILVPIFDYFGTSQSMEPYSMPWSKAGFDHALLRVVNAVTFTGETWFSSVSLFSNAPIWSLNYEFFYYILFAIFTFSTGRRRWMYLTFAVLLFGPKMLLLFPSWVAGVLLYRYRNSIPKKPVIGAAMMVAGIDFVLLGRSLGWHAAWPWTAASDPYLLYASNFPWLNFVGLCIVIHLCGAWMLWSGREHVNPTVSGAIRFLASASYSVYLLHYPIQMMMAAWLWDMESETGRLAVVIGTSLLLSFTLGRFLEPLRVPLKRQLMACQMFSSRRLPTPSVP